MPEETLNKLYEIVISRAELYEEALLANGFDHSTIKELIDNGIIRYGTDAFYELTSADELHKYGLKLLSKREYNKANLCFEKCCEIDPTHRKSLLRLFYLNIRKRNFDRAYQLLEKMNNTIDPELQRENNLYLYLLNYSRISPNEEIKDKVRAMTSEDLLSNEESKKDMNEIILAIVAKKTVLAIGKINALNKKENSPQIHTTIIKELLMQADEIDKEINEKLLELIQAERYFDAETLLLEKSKTKNFKKQEISCLIIIQKIMSMLRTKQIPEVNTLHTFDIYAAIRGNNFELASRLNKEHNIKYNLGENNPLSILLTKIIELIAKLKQEQIEAEKQVSALRSEKNIVTELPGEPIDDTIVLNRGLNTSPRMNSEMPIETIINFSDLLMELLNNNIEKFAELLKQYLKQSGKQEYEYLIIKLVKLSILSGDQTFLNPITTLVEIDKDIFNFNVSLYIQDFYLSIASHNIDVAKVYLEIISRYYSNSQNIIDNLNQTLETEENSLTKTRQPSKVPTVVEITPEEIGTTATIPQPETILIEATEVKAEPPKRNDSKNEGIEEEKRMLLDRIAVMKDRHEGIVLLRNIPVDRRYKIHAAAKSIPELTTFSIGSEPKSMVLRYLNPEAEYIDIKQHLYEMGEAYKKKKYITYIRMARKLIEYPHYSEFKSDNYAKIYARLGLVYLSINDKKEAIKCLTIANGLDEKSPRRIYDFTELITKISTKERTSDEDKKTNPQMKIQDFEDDLNDNFGIKNINEIADYVRAEKLTVEEGCRKFNLTDEEILLVKLIYARDYYTEADYSSGDKLLIEVERSKHKTHRVIKLLNEIRKNKMFYKSRINAHTRTKKQN